LKMPLQSFFRFPLLKNEKGVGIGQVSIELVGQAPGFCVGCCGHLQGELFGLLPAFGFDRNGSCYNDHTYVPPYCVSLFMAAVSYFAEKKKMRPQTTVELLTATLQIE